MHKINVSNRSIARELHLRPQTVDYIVKKFEEDGTIGDRKRSGRPKVTTEREDKLIVRTSRRNRQLTAPQIAAMVNETRSMPVSVTTIKTRLITAGLHGRIAVRKPLLRSENKIKRLQWAKRHQNWTVDDWSKVLWSDESKYEVFGTKRRVFVRRSAGERVRPECIVPSVKHGGGSVVVWGCFGGTSTGDIIKIDGIMDKHVYRSILENNAMTTGCRILGQNFIFQHDNDPKHTAKICKDYLSSQEASGRCTVMVWPPQSPDLNPIELLWDELDRKVRIVCPTSRDDLWTKLKQAWEEISAETLLKLIQRMPRICAAVIKTKGGHIDEAAI